MARSCRVPRCRCCRSAKSRSAPTEAGLVKITDLDGQAVFTSLLAGRYTNQIEIEGAPKLIIGPVPVGQKCVRLPELRVIVPFWISTCY